MVLTVSFALSRVTGFLATLVREIARELGISVGMPGPHDFAVRVGVARLATLSRPPQPRPAFVTIAKRPSSSRRDGVNH